MSVRTVALGVGTAVTTFLCVGAATILLLGAGEAPGIGIVAVAVGTVVGLFAGVVVARYSGTLTGVREAVLVAYATLGIVYLGIAAMSYVNVPGVDSVFTFPVRLGVSVGAAVLAALLSGWLESRERSTKG
ncbi:permease [Haloarculaceae archaeon H-GB2-1]|nr:permease [Haloarculaceae archaeon H-GB1-1]MEA5389503.1 permease [Haloarculaceae archaeon H-GB11]MEA5410043.1 permease [Haloarculaceae archaeon H-GB2-1]